MHSHFVFLVLVVTLMINTASGRSVPVKPLPPIHICCRTRPCTRERKPVCGSDGNTYSNMWLLVNASCQSMNNGGPMITKAHDGPCC